MSEKGLRSLPARALLKLAELEIQHESRNKSKEAATTWLKIQALIQTHETKAAKTMLMDSKLSRLKAVRLGDQLAKMIKTFEETISWLHTIDIKLTKLPKGKEGEWDRKWLEEQKEEATKRILRSGSVQQAKLKGKIYMLNAGADITNELHRGFIKT